MGYDNMLYRPNMEAAKIVGEANIFAPAAASANAMVDRKNKRDMLDSEMARNNADIAYKLALESGAKGSEARAQEMQPKELAKADATIKYNQVLAKSGEDANTRENNIAPIKIYGLTLDNQGKAIENKYKPGMYASQTNANNASASASSARAQETLTDNWLKRNDPYSTYKIDAAFKLGQLDFTKAKTKATQSKDAAFVNALLDSN